MVKFFVFAFLATTILFSNCSKNNDGSTLRPQADFTFSAVGSNMHAPSTINFTNTSITASSYAWEFGDGTTSTSNDPSHRYAAAGNYNVKLTATLAGKTSTKVDLINILPIYTSVKITKISLASTTETSSFNAYFKITNSAGANLYQTTAFTINPAALPTTWTLSTPYTFVDVLTNNNIELWKVGAIIDTKIASGPFLPYLYDEGTVAADSYPTTVASLQGLSFTLQWQ